MGGILGRFRIQLRRFLRVLAFAVHVLGHGCLAVNHEGLALLEFRSRVELDPYGALDNWDPRDGNPCGWTGVRCVDGRVVALELNELSLQGILAPELGSLRQLRTLVLYKNDFSGGIPNEIGRLTMLEMLDLRNNKLNGSIPKEIGEMLSLRHLLLCNNKLQGNTPWIGSPNFHFDLIYDQNLSCDVADAGRLNRKVGYCFWETGLQNLRRVNTFLIQIKGSLAQLSSASPLKKMTSGFRTEKESLNEDEKRYMNIATAFGISNEHVNIARRRLLDETKNLQAASGNSGPVKPVSGIQASGTYHAKKNESKSRPDPVPHSVPNSPPSKTTQTKSAAPEPASNKQTAKWIYALAMPVIALLVIFAILFFVVSRRKGAAPIGPWKTGLSGQLQKAFVTGVPKLNRSELEAACEDFSNIIISFPECTVYKGTLSSGVEIAVVSTVVSVKDWSKQSEMAFRKKIDTLSRINHKNFLSLLGYCEENEPFMRMMVFEYAPNGSLYDHLHVEDFDHLDWDARMRIIMGSAYCLQHMHELNPPVAHPDLQSNTMFLSEDFAVKIADAIIWKEIVAKSKSSCDDDSNNCKLSSAADTASNVYSFAILLLEIISSKVPYNEDRDSFVSLASEYLNGSRAAVSIIDPALKTHKVQELDVICEVIRKCTHPDPRNRPTMKEVTSKLRQVISISPEAATPRLSPLWWAELEILSVEM